MVKRSAKGCMMSKLLTTKAAEYFRRGDYFTALEMYEKLALMLGEECFKVNIELCKKRIAGNSLQFYAVLDEISFASWGSEFRLSPLLREDYIKQLNGDSKDAIFLESCWKGNKGAWEYAFTSPELKHANAQALCNAIDSAKDKGLPVVFWNKEDPMHYERFLSIASRCNILFTTDSNKVADYKRDVPGAHVDVLAFAANQRLCNPVGRFKHEQGTVCFAGSYYSVGHENRKEQMDRLLPTVIQFNGAIYDRMSQLNNKRYAYPSQYVPYIREAVSFTKVVDVYKKFKLFLNVNTITDSPTMMARRVYELLACGTPVISTPSAAIKEQFDNIVQVANDAVEANDIARDLLNDQWKWLHLSHRGYREVMKKHTYRHRAIIIQKALGITAHIDEPTVSIIMASNRPYFIDRIVTNVCRQVHSNIEFIIVIQNYTIEQERKLISTLSQQGGHLKSCQIIRDDSDAPLGARLNKAIDVASGEYVAKMDDDDFYFEHYLTDMLLPFSFGDFAMTGKREGFVYLEGADETRLRFGGERHQTTDFVSGPTFVIRRGVLSNIRFSDLNQGEDTAFLNALRQANYTVYAADPFNFMQFRSKNTNQHTWQVEDAYFSERAFLVGKGLQEQIVRV